MRRPDHLPPRRPGAMAAKGVMPMSCQWLSFIAMRMLAICPCASSSLPCHAQRREKLLANSADDFRARRRAYLYQGD